MSNHRSKRESETTLASARCVRIQRQGEEGWYKRRTSIEKILLATTFVVLVIVVILAVGLAYFGAATLRNCGRTSLLTSNGEICITPGCVDAAAKIFERIDTKIDPCEDFHQFACGNYERNLVIPDDKFSVTEFSLINDELQRKLRLIVEAPISTRDDVPSALMVKNLYKSCLDVETIESKGVSPLRQVLEWLGDWPVVKGNSWTPTKWTDIIYKCRKIGYSVDYLFDFSVMVDMRNSSSRIIALDQPVLGMPRKLYLEGLDNNVIRAYQNYQIEMALLLGAKKTDAEKALKDAFEFEKTLAMYSKDQEDRRNISEMYNKMQLSQLQKIAPSIPWKEYTNKVLASAVTKEITEDEPILVTMPKYFVKLSNLLEKTPPKVVANYILWKVVSSTVGALSDDIRDIKLKFLKILTGKATREPRWKDCMTIVSESLSHAVGALYAKNFFKENAKDAADEMVSFIRAEFERILHKVDWMDDKTKMRALKKLQKITTHIAYPKEILNDRNLQELYKGLYVSEGDFLENLRNLTNFGNDFSFQQLREKVDKGHWRSYGSIAVVNAFYSHTENSIQFPAGILQGMFFDVDRPKYMNYGGIGFVIGHEITHGFDDTGRQFDENGDLYNWWDSETKAKFLQKAKCIIEQYGNYTVPEIGMKINGKNTQGENIADNGGIKEAYRAYKRWTLENGVEQMLPGLPYTANQLFWLSAAHVWCGKYTTEKLLLKVMEDSHSPTQFRINGPMINTKEFSNDWKCPVGSSMNPVKKCTVW